MKIKYGGLVYPEQQADPKRDQKRGTPKGIFSIDEGESAGDVDRSIAQRDGYHCPTLSNRNPNEQRGKVVNIDREDRGEEPGKGKNQGDGGAQWGFVLRSNFVEFAFELANAAHVKFLSVRFELCRAIAAMQRAAWLWGRLVVVSSSDSARSRHGRVERRQ